MRNRRAVLYVAYPMRLDLGAANAIQTYNSVRELRRLLPGTRLVVPRWLREPSAFGDLDALHLPRPAMNKLSRLLPWAGWSYLERTLYSMMLVLILVCWRAVGKSYRILYVRDAVCAAWLSFLDPLHGSRVIYEVHDLEAQHPSKAARWPRPFWGRFLPWLDSLALGRPCKLVSLTETFKHWLVEAGTRIADDVKVIPDAFDPQVYFPVDRQEARAALGLPPAAYIIGYAGLTFAYRRLDLLVEAFAKISQSCDNALLVLVGGRPSEVAELRAQASMLKVPAAKIVMPGSVSQERAALFLNAADILVIPDTVTQLTASPLKLFEYMAVGKPIVLKDMNALREILNGDAEYFSEGDVSSLVSALQRLRLDPARSSQIAAGALARASAFTYAARAENIRSMILDCL